MSNTVKNIQGWLRAIVYLALALGLAVAFDRFADSSEATPRSGRATVIDGDTLEIDGERIRIFGVDAPEYAQLCEDSAGQQWPCGRASARELARWLAGRTVTCTKTATDIHERTVARCTADKDDLGAWLVRTGAARAFKSFSAAYLTQEAEAEREHRGIWQGPHEAPWDWRARHHPKPRSASVLADW